MSTFIELCKSVTKLINETPFEWPIEIMPGTPGRLDTVVTTRTVVVPLTKLETQVLSIFVLPVPTGRTQTDDSAKRCRRKWSYQVTVAIAKRLDTEDVDLVQPATLAEISNMMLFGEAMTDFLDENRQVLVNGSTGSMVELEHEVSIDAEMLRDRRMFLTEINATYRIT